MPEYLVRVNANLRLPEWMIDELDMLDGSRGELVEQALIYYYDWEAPK